MDLVKECGCRSERYTQNWGHISAIDIGKCGSVWGHEEGVLSRKGIRSRLTMLTFKLLRIRGDKVWRARHWVRVFFAQISG